MKQIGEFQLIDRLCRGLSLSRRTLIGPGDDCAVLAPGRRPQLATIDSMVEGVHFRLEWFKPAALGARALTVNLSDIAAMGGRGRSCLVNLGLRPGLKPALLEEIYAGLRRAARAAEVDLVGGNITSAAQLTLTIALLGEAELQVLRRDRARPGDAIFVTGTLGDAAVGWRLLAGKLNAPPAARRVLIGRYLAPTARIAAGLRLARLTPVPAAIDISDGLLQDLGHIMERSGCGALVETARLPLSPAYRAVAGASLDYALGGGEDYELLFCLTTRRSEAELSRHLGVKVTRIGEILSRRAGLRLRDAQGRPVAATAPAGWAQLRARDPLA
jgi:thiamine-monophosphate kinase